MLLYLLTSIAVCVILLTGIALGVVYWLVKHPPQLNFKPVIDIPPISVNVDVGEMVPGFLGLEVRMVPSDRQLSNHVDEPMPVDVFTYINQESEEHARVSRGQHARRLKTELGDWTLVLQQLKKEDESA